MDALEAAALGDPTKLETLLLAPDDLQPSERDGLLAMRYLVRGGEPPPPPGPFAGAMAATAARLHQRVSWLRGDAEGLRRCGDALSGFHDLKSRLGQLWAAAFVGRYDWVRDEGDVLQSEAVRANRAGIVVEAAALRALASAELGDMPTALDAARRASRIGRTEALPQAEYVTGWVLARIRRLSGSPHLATRILAGLRRFAPSCWHDVIDAEGVMADGRGATGGWSGRLSQRIDVDGSCDAPTAWLHRDLRLVAAVVHGRPLDDVASGTIDDWRHGRTHTAPLGTIALALRHPERAAAYVIAAPGALGQRRVAAGQSTGELCPISPGARGRVDALLSRLALAGPAGLDAAELFRRVWGFAYVHELHFNPLNVTLHRARQKLDDGGQIHRGQRIALQLSRELWLPDPLCAPLTEHRVLHHLARRPGASARELANGLGIALRTVQSALKSLVREGACRSEREGRAIAYRVEDTTFREPTLA